MSNFPPPNPPQNNPPQNNPGEPPQPGHQQPFSHEPQKNTLGLIALIVGVVGFIFGVIPGTLIVGWILLPIAFILGIVGVALSGKKKATSIAAIIVSVVGAVVSAIVFIAVVAGSIEEAFEDDDLDPVESLEADDANEPDDADPDDTEETEDTAGTAEGTRDNPVPFGESVSSEEWTIKVDEPHEATDEVLAENELNDEPEDGMEFWILPVEATYTGDDKGHAWLDLTFKFVSDEGQSYNTYEPGCGPIPDDLDDVDEIYEGATAKGNVCVQTPEGAEGTWTVETFLGDSVFFSTN